MKTIVFLTFFISLNTLASFYPKELLEMSDKIPNAVYYLSKDDCEKNYFKECVKLPEGYNREYHDYNNGFTENSAKKTRYNEVKAALNKLKSNQDLNQEEIKKVLVYLLRGVN